MERWTPTFVWHKINADAYEIILAKAEARFEGVLSESNEITKQAFKIITGLTASFAFFIAVTIENKLRVDFLLVGAFLLNVIISLILLFPKKIKEKGIPPKVLIPDQFDSDEDKLHQKEMILYCAVVIVQENIDFMENKNSSRHKLYILSLVLAISVFVLGAVDLARIF